MGRSWSGTHGERPESVPGGWATGARPLRGAPSRIAGVHVRSVLAILQFKRNLTGSTNWNVLPYGILQFGQPRGPSPVQLLARLPGNNGRAQARSWWWPEGSRSMWHFQDWLVQLGIPTETEWIEGGMGSRLREQMEAIKRCYRNDVWTAPSSSEIPACWSMPAPKKTQHRANAGLFCGQICPWVNRGRC